MDNYYSQGERGTTDWAYRDGRNGFIDNNTSRAVKKLFENHHTNGINFDKYFEIPIEISEGNIPQLMSFADCEVHEALLSNLKKFGYNKPTPVQQYAIPVSLLRRDLMACAQTGSGKTAAYLYPLVAKMLQDGPPPNYSNRTARPVSLVMAPTRELTVQIYEETLKFTYLTGMRVVVVYGGASVSDQERKLLDGADIIIATPGRLIDFIERGVINLYIVRYLILDEADRMLDMGFEPQLIKVLTAIKKVDRETIMCSATFPREIQDIAMKYLKNYVKLSVGRVGSTTENITQKLMLVRSREKEDFLVSLLMELKGQILIFVERKNTANEISGFLQQQGVRCTSIHGDRQQQERERALNDFKNQTVNILIATDVASRGLDIPNVAYVIIYDLPSNIDSYVHRIGRTGRIGNTGVALTLVEDRQVPVLNDLLTILIECKQVVPEWFNELLRSGPLLPEWYADPNVSNISRPATEYRGNSGNNRGFNIPSSNRGYDGDRGYGNHGRGYGGNSYGGDHGYENRGYGGRGRSDYNRGSNEYSTGSSGFVGGYENNRGRGNYEPKPSGYGGYDRGGYDRGAQDRGGYSRGGQDRGGYNRFGQDRGGYEGSNERGAYDRGGYERGGYGRGYQSHARGGPETGYNEPRNYPRNNDPLLESPLHKPAAENDVWGESAGSNKSNSAVRNPPVSEGYNDWSGNQPSSNYRGRGNYNKGYDSEPRENYGRGGYRGRGNNEGYGYGGGYEQRGGGRGRGGNEGGYGNSYEERPGGRGRGGYRGGYNNSYKQSEPYGGDSEVVDNLPGRKGNDDAHGDPWGSEAARGVRSSYAENDAWAGVAEENKSSLQAPLKNEERTVIPVVDDDPWA